MWKCCFLPHLREVFSLSEVLIHVTRGPLVESLHRGDVAVVNIQGELLHYVGDPYKVTYIRSAAKPLMALEVIKSGAAQQYGFSDAELAIMCASHYGEAFHRSTVESILQKLNLSMDHLLCGTTTSLNPQYALEFAATGQALNPSNNDCSGKHAGMLALCLINNYSLEDYPAAFHPLQQKLKRLVAQICGLPESEIVLGVDGCTVPVFGMPLYHMALGYARLANPQYLEQSYQFAARRIYQAMNNHPEMIAGTQGFCTQLLANTHGKLVGKLGSEGIYCIGLKDRELGVAIKIEDGNHARAIPPATMQVLEDLQVLTREELSALQQFKVKPNLNNIQSPIGEIKPAFHLHPFQP